MTQYNIDLGREVTLLVQSHPTPNEGNLWEIGYRDDDPVYADEPYFKEGWVQDYMTADDIERLGQELIKIADAIKHLEKE